jgi:hypothetical protein
VKAINMRNFPKLARWTSGLRTYTAELLKCMKDLNPGLHMENLCVLDKQQEPKAKGLSYC